jgi:hypothetical protein
LYVTLGVEPRYDRPRIELDPLDDPWDECPPLDGLE